MADIGGCRLILKDLPTLEAVRKELEQSAQLKKRLYIEKTNDYIQSPKGRDCGYRCLHLIYRYIRSDERSFKIEAQLRTELQHVWATTVEIIDVIEHTNIKTHSHAPNENKLEKQRQWEELLSIMSRFIAGEEGVVSLSDKEKQDDASRLRELESELNAVSKLESFRMLGENLSSLDADVQGNVLFVIDEDKRRIVKQQVFKDEKIAILIYNFFEKFYSTQNHRNMLLVSTKDLAALRSAYPNYIGDCHRFIDLMKKVMQ